MQTAVNRIGLSVRVPRLQSPNVPCKTPMVFVRTSVHQDILDCGVPQPDAVHGTADINHPVPQNTLANVLQWCGTNGFGRIIVAKIRSLNWIKIRCRWSLTRISVAGSVHCAMQTVRPAKRAFNSAHHAVTDPEHTHSTKTALFAITAHLAAPRPPERARRTSWRSARDQQSRYCAGTDNISSP